MTTTATPPDKAAIAGVEAGPAPDPDVELIIGEAGPKGRRPTRRTLHTILSHDPTWSGRLRLDSFNRHVALDGRPITDPDLTRMSCWIEDVYRATPSIALLHEVSACVGDENPFHPVRDYLKELRWDGRERVPHLLPRYLGVADSPLVRAMGQAFLVGGVARVMEPGCKFDTMLVLIGKQGARKSSFCAALVPDPAFFADTGLDLRTKDGYIALTGKWIYEFAEMEALRGRDAARVKSFMSSSTDYFRAPYERTSRDHPRHCIFIGTANHVLLFSDPTGSRRFWPVEIGVIDIEAVLRDRDQLWAEACERYRRGEKWYLDASMEHEREALQGRYQRTDPRQDRLDAWLRTIPEGASFTTAEAIVEGLGAPAEEVNHSYVTAVGPILDDLGCRKIRARVDGEREWRWLPPHRGAGS